MVIRTGDRRPNRWRALAAAAVVSGALGAVGCSSEESGDQAAQDADETLRIGALLPMTGDLQAYGQTTRNGVQLAQTEINSDGGVLGNELAIEVGDTQTKPQAGIDAAKKLISVEGASAIVGALSSGVTIPVAKSVTSKEGVPQVSNASTSPEITGLDDNDFMFRTVPSDAFQGRALGEIVAEDGLTNVSIMYVNNDYGEGLANSFTEAFEGSGGTVDQSLGYEKGNASYRSELSKAAGEDTEALVLIGYPESGVTILRQAIEGGHFDQFVFTDGLKAPEIIEAVGADALEGSLGSAPQSGGGEAAEHFKTGYEGMHGEVPPKPFIDTAYDATYVLALAAQAAGSTDPKALRDELRHVANPPGEEVLPGEWSKALDLLEQGEDINYSGASGPIDFDDNGDVGGSFAHWVIRDGEIQTERVFKPGE